MDHNAATGHLANYRLERGLLAGGLERKMENSLLEKL